VNPSASASAPAAAAATAKPLKLPDLTIEGFRGFERFHFPKLARVNLLVGPNNSGKTTVLEAVEMLALEDSVAIALSSTRRQEYRQIGGKHWFDYSRGFTGSEVRIGASLRVTSRSSFAAWELQSIPGASVRSSGWMFDFEMPGTQTTLELDDPEFSPLTDAAWLSSRPISWHDPLTRVGLNELWEKAVLGPEEGFTLQTLRILEPRLESLAFVAGSPMAKVGNHRTPLASFGEGMNLLLGLALRIANAKGGVLLIDEIDTGLYYRTLPQVWKLVIETARKLDVQVFATTHSRDCLEALADLDLDPEFDGSDVLVHRIDPGASQAVTYDLERLVRAVSHNIEVR
jgi:AAA domain, putative AbiEii toxin, Type IV TA system/AAA domain